ncbi:MAG: DUF4160 domain-containing protein [Actinobacteria bacterium]|nr:DUF4160 domain-containing protein [Actinomycetota bacterium]
MESTVFFEMGYRFLFFSREESRMHVHVQSAEGEAKFWVEPRIDLATSRGLPTREIRVVERIIREREHDIRSAWRRHFSG